MFITPGCPDEIAKIFDSLKSKKKKKAQAQTELAQTFLHIFVRKFPNQFHIS